MNLDQWNLLARANPTWGRLWLIADFDAAQKYIAASLHSGSGDERGVWFKTDAKGLRLVRLVVTSGSADGPLAEFAYREDLVLDLPWSTVKDWTRSLTAAERDEAIRLHHRTRGHARACPDSYPGIGRTYAWDRDGSTEYEIAFDRAALAEAHRRREVLVDQWHADGHAHEEVVRAFLAGLAPSDDPSDLVELLAAQT